MHTINVIAIQPSYSVDNYGVFLTWCNDTFGAPGERWTQREHPATQIQEFTFFYPEDMMLFKMRFHDECRTWNHMCMPIGDFDADG